MSEPTRTTQELDELDEITRQIDIDATAERVWELVVRPGWYVNDGVVDEHPDVRLERDDSGREITVLVHPEMGEFRFRTVELDEPRYAAFRWLGTPYREVTEGTLVEFWIEQREGGVTLHVRESGFSTLSEDPAVWLKEREGNDSGWAEELLAAKAYVEGRS